MPSVILNLRTVISCGHQVMKRLFSPSQYQKKGQLCNIIETRWIHTRYIASSMLRQNINGGTTLYQIPVLLSNSSYRHHSSFHSKRKEQVFDTSKETELMKDILDHVIYEDDCIIAINKPSGVTVFGQKIREQEDSKGYCLPISAASRPEPNACVADIMPLLRVHFKSPTLTIVHSIKMFYSGVLLMAKDNASYNRIMQSLDRAKSLGTLYQSYLAITVGIPKKDRPVKSTLYLKQERIKDRVLSLSTENISNNLRKSGKIQKMEIRTTILKKNEILNCALVRFDTVKDKWQSLEVHCTTLLCHVLGDYLYSGRLGKIFGTPVLLEPHLSSVGKQKLPEELKLALKQELSQSGQMPLYLHRVKVDLTQMKVSEPVLSIVAPFPKHFLQTLRNLQLEYPFEDIFNTETSK